MLDDAVQKLFQVAISQAEDEELRKELELARSIELPDLLLEDCDEDDEASNEGMAQMIRDMTIPAKMKLALLGNQTARNILIRDTNRQIQMFVLQNPRLRDAEVQDFAKNSSLDESVLREIAKNGTWMKNYTVKCSIVSNPKTPIDVSLGWVKYLRDKDLRTLGKSKNVPQVVANQCKKLSEKRG